jgi:hypothetical protein
MAIWRIWRQRSTKSGEATKMTQKTLLYDQKYKKFVSAFEIDCRPTKTIKLGEFIDEYVKYQYEIVQNRSLRPKLSLHPQHNPSKLTIYSAYGSVKHIRKRVLAKIRDFRTNMSRDWIAEMRKHERRPFNEDELKELQIYCIAHLGQSAGEREFNTFCDMYWGRIPFDNTKLRLLNSKPERCLEISIYKVPAS